MELMVFAILNKRIQIARHAANIDGSVAYGGPG